jgi:hypothetical protein
VEDDDIAEIGSMGRKMLDEDNPKMFFIRSEVKTLPIPKQFTPTTLGNDCDVDEISTIAMKVEYQEHLSHLRNNDDPWYEMSVKDRLETSHIDGSHTTVRSKASKRSVMSEFDRVVAMQMERYGDYEGIIA